ncbi:hypothetical protein [Nocardia seriolae]|uniref:Outer membrane channel protein CpnT-like N-terminal domain-containing protein n=1 Tax=Nocardia seriolae TaxID=37332 RepID=A0ABC9YQ38_9NOCA|nr:hypothetical protein [Nocardia seriolae]OJF81587.1 hypothetical protein NS14008_23460 [Nocardia seriolae]PSK32854.1 hypothetical protein C6575_03295 [Nocardia seriolae]QOW34395.1 hypothetical protein IMZ23_04710 [Nocardia seriolae]QUN18149.1 hypothetical protein KEC46_01325 [Nocardia seriolae]RLP33087.1 hypothetical protein D6158_03980 [Nocardia seriolae]
MSIDIPGELQWLGWVAGSAWPQGDEDAMWGIAADWGAAARQLRDLLPELEAAKKATVAAYPWGDGLDAMVAALDKLDSGPQSIEALADILDQVAEAADGLGTEIEYTKIMMLSALAMLAVEIALAWLFPPTAPAEEAAATVATRIAVRILGERAVSAIARYAGKLGIAALARFLAKHVAMSTVLGAGQDLAIQGLQIAEGHRKGMDWERVGMTALTAAAAGAVGGPTAELLGKAATHLPFAGNPFGNAVRGALVGTGSGIAGGLASWGAGGLPTLLTQGTTDGWTWDPRILTSSTAYGVLTGATKGFRLPTPGVLHPTSFEAPAGARIHAPAGGDGGAPAPHPDPATTSHPATVPDPAGTPRPQAASAPSGDPATQPHPTSSTFPTEPTRPLTNLSGDPGSRTASPPSPEPTSHGASSTTIEPNSRAAAPPAPETATRGGTTPTAESGPRASTSSTPESNSRGGAPAVSETNTRAGSPAAPERNSRAGNPAAAEPNSRAGNPAAESGARAAGPAAEPRVAASGGDGSAPVPAREPQHANPTEQSAQPVAVGRESGVEAALDSAREQVRSLGVDPDGMSPEQLRRAGLEAGLRRLSELDGEYGRLIDDFGQFTEKYAGESGPGPAHGEESAPTKQPTEAEGPKPTPQPAGAVDPRLAWRLPPHGEDDDVPDTSSVIPYTPRFFSIPPIPEYSAPAPPPDSVWEPEDPPRPHPPQPPGGGHGAGQGSGHHPGQGHRAGPVPGGHGRSPEGAD